MQSLDLCPYTDFVGLDYENTARIPSSEPISHCGANSLSGFHSYLQQRLQVCDQNQYSASKLQVGFEFIQHYRETMKYLSFPVSEAPSLVFGQQHFLNHGVPNPNQVLRQRYQTTRMRSRFFMQRKAWTQKILTGSAWGTTPSTPISTRYSDRPR
jgi:hypothetical protein